MSVVLAASACGRIQFDEVADAAPPADAPPSTEILGPGTWTSVPAGPLSPRVWTRAIWSGTEFVVFSGALDPAYTASSTGARFDPRTQAWSALTEVGAPSPRHTAMLARVGEQMLTYGGATELITVAGGGRYDLATDTWTPIAAGPVGVRIYSELHAIGERLLLWGGLQSVSTHYQSGFLYDPATDQWTAMSTVGAPSARSFAGSVWTGSELIVWGGCSGGMPSCPTVFGDGAIYDPALDSWRPMSATLAPVARDQHSAVWTGTEMIVFGGITLANEGGPINTGAIYTPATDSWRPITTDGAPGPRSDHAAVWLGTKMLIWGSSTALTDGYLYDPAIDQWSKISSAAAPSGRTRFAYATDGRRLFVWGGSFSEATGAIWSPEP